MNETRDVAQLIERLKVLRIWLETKRDQDEENSDGDDDDVEDDYVDADAD